MTLDMVGFGAEIAIKTRVMMGVDQDGGKLGNYLYRSIN